MAKLVVITKGTPGLAHELNGHWTTVGRADGNIFQILEASVSGRHCEVRVQGDELLVRDLLSTNGTFVRGEKITEATLKPGHTMRLGEVELRFENASPVTSPGKPFTGSMLLTNSARITLPKNEAATSKLLPVIAGPKPAGRTETGTEPTKTYHALFVDDSLAFLETFTELFSALSNKTWKIHSATTADRALSVLQESPIDLVVLDVGIPMLDGLQLLGIIKRRHPGIKVAVMTGNASDTNRATALSNGAELFLNKPVTHDDVRVVFNMLNDLVSWKNHEGFSGTLRQVGLQEVIQMECIARHSSILEIRNQQLLGKIYIEAGVVTHAEAGALAGEPAFNQLLSLAGGEFQLNPFEPPEQRTVHERWELLLMEAARLADEETAIITNPANPNPSPDKINSITPPPPAVAAEQTRQTVTTGELSGFDEEIVVVATYDGKWNLSDSAK